MQIRSRAVELVCSVAFFAEYPALGSGTAFRRATLVLTLMLTGCVTPAISIQPVSSGPIAERVDGFVRDSLKAFSGQILVARGGNIVLHRAYGLADREASRRNSVETGFDIGSLTKQFTAAAIVALVQDARLSVSDTLGAFFPELSGEKLRISLHQLLTHSSGFPQYSGEDYDLLTAAGLEGWMDTVSLEFTPGERFRYSNPGYSILALVVEKVSGLPFEKFVQVRLLRPAGLRKTGYRVPNWSVGNLAVGYNDSEGRVGTPLDRLWFDDGPSWNLRGNGGMLSTAWELYQWQQSLTLGKVLSPNSVQRLVSGHVETGRPGRQYGYGWYATRDAAGRTFTDHTGGNGSFFTLLRWYGVPDVVLVVTSNAFNAEQISALIAALVRFAVDPRVP